MTAKSNTSVNHPTGFTVAPVARFTIAIALIGVLALSNNMAAFAQDAKKGTGALVQRIEQLEAQIVDMQVVIGTLQSLPQSTLPSNAAAQPYDAPATANDQARLDGMETQIRALTAQIEQMAEQLRRQDAPGRQGTLPNSYREQPQYDSGPEQVAPPASTAAVSGFGSTTVQPAQDLAPDPVAEAPRRDDAFAALEARSVDGNDPRKAYETAYGFLLQQQYGAAESAFSNFLNTYGKDPLAGNAQYWLGETYYVRGQYKSAAKAFLKGYDTYASSQKAPDSLLKLAMSFDKLGQKDAACSSLSELVVKFPQAQPHVVKRATTERRRMGC